MNSNVKNIYFNTIIGFILKILLLVLSFVNRTIFIDLLGSEYLGISGLYANIISLLSLADLGIYTAFMFSLYKPLNEKNYNEINALIKYFSKLYRIIGVLVIIVGLCLTPFLKYLVNNSSLTESEFISYFILFVLNSGLSYFNICKSTLLRADKKVYVVDAITSAATILTYVFQIVFLLITKSYYSYIIVQIVLTVLMNFLLTVITNKKYPYLKKKNDSISLGNEVKSNVIKNIKSVLIYKIGGVIMNSTDNILISIMLGTVVVGYYSNYSLIIVTITTFITIIINAILPNIGEINAKGDSQKTLQAFNITTYFFNVLAIFVTATLICVFNDFIELWIKDEEYILNNIDVIMIALNFYITCISNPLWMFRESTGLFKDVKFLLIIAAVLNIILSYVLGEFMGLGGIILATGISRLLTMFWFEPMLLFKKIFKTNSTKYWLKLALYIIIALVVSVSSYMICDLLTVSIVNFLLKIVICFGLTAITVLALTFKTKEFGYIINIITRRRK